MAEPRMPRANTSFTVSPITFDGNTAFMDGEPMTQKEVCAHFQKRVSTVQSRMAKGMSLSDALTKPVRAMEHARGEPQEFEKQKTARSQSLLTRRWSRMNEHFDNR